MVRSPFPKPTSSRNCGPQARVLSLHDGSSSPSTPQNRGKIRKTQELSPSSDGFFLRRRRRLFFFWSPFFEGGVDAESSFFERRLPRRLPLFFESSDSSASQFWSGR